MPCSSVGEMWLTSSLRRVGLRRHGVRLPAELRTGAEPPQQDHRRQPRQEPAAEELRHVLEAHRRHPGYAARVRERLRVAAVFLPAGKKRLFRLCDVPNRYRPGTPAVPSVPLDCFVLISPPRSGFLYSLAELWPSFWQPPITDSKGSQKPTI